MAVDVEGDIRATGGVSAQTISTAGALSVSGNLAVSGNLTVNGKLTAPTKIGCVTDRFVYRSAQPLERGDVVVLGLNAAAHFYGPDNIIPLVEVDLTNVSRDARVCGIVHTPALSDTENPGIDRTPIGNAQIGLMVTLGAYAFCKVDADPAPIVAGDLLTTSSAPGYAQKLDAGSTATGAVIAKALAALDRGKGIIPVLVSHQ